MLLPNPKLTEAENWAQWEQASADDILKELGETSEKEYKYYMSLPEKAQTPPNENPLQ